MIVGNGIDIIEVARIEKAMLQKRFVERVFSPREMSLLNSRNGNAQTAAGGFAAKEAVAKALGTGIGVVSFCEIEVLRDEAGRPFAELSGAARARLEELGGKRIHVSISHVAAVAVAQAIIED